MTGIQWTDETWNPVTGCTKVSAGCKNCYAERLAPRAFAGQTVCIGSTGVISEVPRRFTDVRCHPERLDAPLRWRKPRRVSVNSMSDLFHEDVPDEFIDSVFVTMAVAAQHTFQVLTKRPERMLRYVAGRPDELHRIGTREALTTADWLRHRGRPLSNVWLGVSCEDQRAADERIPLLLDTPAAVRFLSCEPLIGPIDLDLLSDCPNKDEPGHIDWVIVGGESGPNARPCDIAWVRSIVEQCEAAGVACFVKQLGAKPIARDRWDMGEEAFSHMDAAGWDEHHGPIVVPLRDRKGGDPSEWLEDLRVRQFPGGQS